MQKAKIVSTLEIVWYIYSAAALVLVITAIALPKDMILAYTPICYSIKQFGRTCFMCGSTRSFIQAGSGNFKAAYELNRMALILFIAIIVNTIIVLLYIKTSNKSKKHETG